jgi:flavin-dependent dehydrogenase
MAHDVIIVGGGLAGLTAATEFSRAGFSTLLLERKSYPYHKVCGEYISHEVLPYLRSLGFDPYEHGAARISRLRLSTPSGKNLYAPLEPGGFGLSRYTMDDALQQLAQRCGAEVHTNTRVTGITLDDGLYTVTAQDGGSWQGRICIGSWGKRDTLDKKLDRSFLKEHTGYMGVKYHIRTDLPEDEIGLDNFPGGYCGVSRIEGGVYNLCYLYQRRFGGNYKSIRELEEAQLFSNPTLKRIFQNSDFLFEQPVSINEISFAARTQSEQGIFMAGDTAGLITPLCGNGMSMAIAGARLLSKTVLETGLLQRKQFSDAERSEIVERYAKRWKQQFGQRLFWGRKIQSCFGSPTLSEVVLRGLHFVPPLERWLISKTHGAEVGS